MLLETGFLNRVSDLEIKKVRLVPELPDFIFFNYSELAIQVMNTSI